MTRSRDTSRVRANGTRNLARIVVAGFILAGGPLAMTGTANAVMKLPTASDDVWDQIAQCESGGQWNTNTGNGYSGGLQFSPHTWRAYGGTGSASGASRTEQITVAERVLAAQGWGAWPACSLKVGARGKAASRTVSSTTRRHSTASRTTQTRVRPSAPSTPAPAAGQPGANYTVVAGDTLSTIAARHNIPGGWQALFEANRTVLSDPNVLTLGQRLTVG